MDDDAKRLNDVRLLSHYQRLYFDARREVCGAHKGIARLRKRLQRTREEWAGDVRLARTVNDMERLKWAVYGAIAGIALYKIGPWFDSLFN